MAIRTMPTEALSDAEIDALRQIFAVAWEGEEAFTEDDWLHACGGTHIVDEVDGRIVAHASVIQRRLQAGELFLDTGYVEAVATAPSFQRQGFGTRIMREAHRLIDENFELGALGTDVFDFYVPLGWAPWGGPTGVRTADGVERTPEDDGFVLVRRTRTTPVLDDGALLTCEWRPGDVW